MSQRVDSNKVIEKLVLRIANETLNSVMNEVALEEAMQTIAALEQGTDAEAQQTMPDAS